MKIHTTKIYNEDLQLNPGVAAIVEKKLLVGTATLPLEIIGVQMEGKQRSTALDFINAYKELLTSNTFTAAPQS